MGLITQMMPKDRSSLYKASITRKSCIWINDICSADIFPDCFLMEVAYSKDKNLIGMRSFEQKGDIHTPNVYSVWSYEDNGILLRPTRLLGKIPNLNHFLGQYKPIFYKGKNLLVIKLNERIKAYAR